MKSFYKNVVIVLALSSLMACSVKSSHSNKPPVADNLPSSVSPVAGSSSGTSAPSCDGVVRDGVTHCYYKNISTLFASGGNLGQSWWSSTSFIASSGNSPNQFSTDATFNVRIIPRAPVANATSTFGKTCSPYRMYATKLQVQLMLHKNGVSVGEVATLNSTIGSPSNVWHFTNLPRTSDPLILEVVNVQSDSRCTGFYGEKPSSCTSTPYLDIPINTTGPTECVAFDIQYSTDSTYDLPGASAN